MHPTLRSLTACLCLLSAPDVIPDHVKSVAGDAAVIEKPPAPEPKKELLLLMLALAGGTWLWHRARHASPQLALA